MINSSTACEWAINPPHTALEPTIHSHRGDASVIQPIKKNIVHIKSLDTKFQKILCILKV